MDTHILQHCYGIVELLMNLYKHIDHIIKCVDVCNVTYQFTKRFFKKEKGLKNIATKIQFLVKSTARSTIYCCNSHLLRCLQTSKIKNIKKLQDPM